MTNASQKRLAYLDGLKILATFMIIVLHLSALYVRTDAALIRADGSLPYLFNSCMRVALPIFMMISGALLLREGYHFQFRKKFFFILKNFLFWTTAYAAIEQAFRWYAGEALFTAEELVASWIRGPYHFWYLWMLMGFYILMPLLEKIKPLQTLSYATLLLFITGYVIDPISTWLPAPVQFVAAQLFIVPPLNVLFFFLLGAWLSRLPRQRNFIILSCFNLLIGLGLRIYPLFHTATYGQGMVRQPFSSYSELLVASALFYLASAAFGGRASGKGLKGLSASSLRIFIISPLVIYCYDYLIQTRWDALCPWPTLSILLWAVLVFITTALVAAMLSYKDRLWHAWRQKRRGTDA